MSDADGLTKGQMLTGSLFRVPVRVKTGALNGPSAWTVGLVGTQSERFRNVGFRRQLLLGDDATTKRMLVRKHPPHYGTSDG